MTDPFRIKGYVVSVKDPDEWDADFEQWLVGRTEGFAGGIAGKRAYLVTEAALDAIRGQGARKPPRRSWWDRVFGR